MHMRWSAVSQAAAFSIVLASAVAALAAEPLETVRVTIDKALAVVETDGLSDEAKIRELRQIVVPVFDFLEFWKRSLGRHWEPNKGRVEAFTPTFQKFIECTLVKQAWLKERGVKVQYTGEKKEDGSASVETKFTRKEVDTPVEFRFHRVGSDWKAYDVSVEGLSWVGNYRAQFNSVIARKGLDALLEDLRKRAGC